MDSFDVDAGCIFNDLFISRSVPGCDFVPFSIFSREKFWKQKTLKKSLNTSLFIIYYVSEKNDPIKATGRLCILMLIFYM